MKRIILLLIAALAFGLTEAQTVPQKMATPYDWINGGYFLNRLGIPSDTTSFTSTPNMGTRAGIAVLNGRLFFRDPVAGKWVMTGNSTDNTSGNTTGGATGETFWGTLLGTLNNQTDLRDTLSHYQFKLPWGTTGQYYDGTKQLRTFNTDVQTFGDSRYVKLTDLNPTGNGVGSDTLVFTDGLVQRGNEVAANFFAPMWNANRIQGYNVTPVQPKDKSILVFDATTMQWKVDTTGVQGNVTVTTPSWDATLAVSATTARNATTSGTLTGATVQSTNGQAWMSEFGGYGYAKFRDGDGIIKTEIIADNSTANGWLGRINSGVLTFKPITTALPSGFATAGYGSLYVRAGQLRLNIDGTEQTFSTGSASTLYTADGSLSGNRTVGVAGNKLTWDGTNADVIMNNTFVESGNTKSATLFVSGANGATGNSFWDYSLWVKGGYTRLDGMFWANPSSSGFSDWQLFVDDGQIIIGDNRTTNSSFKNYILLNNSYMTFHIDAGDYKFDNLQSSTNIDRIVGWNSLTSSVYQMPFDLQVKGIVQYTPISAVDNNYQNGTVSFTDSYIYYKTSTGTWKRLAWSADTW